METINRESFKTKFRIAKEARELAIYNDWKELMSQPGAMSSGVGNYLCEKYDIHSISTIQVIVKRVEKRLKEEGKL